MCNFEDLLGCGKCNIYLSEPSHMKLLSPISMSDVVNVVFKFCINNSDKRIVLEGSTISCNGNINISYIEMVDSGRENKEICRGLLSSWYRYHKHILYNAIVLVYIARITTILNSVASDNELIEEAMKLNDALNQLTQ